MLLVGVKAGCVVTYLAFPLSSRAALRKLAPRMLLSQPPARLVSYARLLPTSWKRIELERTLGRKKLSTILREALNFVV